MPRPGGQSRQATDAVPAGLDRPVVQSLLFVGTWMALGWLLPRDPNLYLLAGVPLTLAFQVLVRGRPVRRLWVRHGPPFRLDAKGWAIAGALALYPAYHLVRAPAAGQWSTKVLLGCAVPGAVAAAYALRQLRRGSVRVALRWLALTAGVGATVMVAISAPGFLTSSHPQPAEVLGTFARSALVYFPLTFVIEEVSFRGALDAHLYRPGQPRPWLSALLVSTLWGVWHLPIADSRASLAATVAPQIALSCVIGVPLSFAWRRTGSLAVPALAHALTDAVRNALTAPL
ncbi:MAG TPA: CPBP family intramembrane glutamic endopeptidase [Actinomycetes bacterium]|nr:CPBP family intramembrane glutamic endopeptidase [Actinomycetes bacterium]